MKNTHNKSNQMSFRISDTGEMIFEVESDESCYNLQDVARYVYKKFQGKKDVPNEEIWEYLSEHPIFPVLNYKNKIKDVLKNEFGVKTSRNTMSF